MLQSRSRACMQLVATNNYNVGLIYTAVYMAEDLQFPIETPFHHANLIAMKTLIVHQNPMKYCCWSTVVAFALIAGCHKEISDRNTSTPVAKIAAIDSIMVLPISSVQLDGSESYDPDGGDLTFSWRLSTTVAGASIAPANTKTPKLQGIQPGYYQIILTVTSLISNRSGHDTIGLRIVDPATRNRPPVADPGINRDTIYVMGIAYWLDGSGSSDPDGNFRGGKWKQIAGPTATLLQPGSLKCAFLASDTGLYIFELTVTDSLGLADTATMTYHLVKEVPPPTPYLYAGPDQVLGLPMDSGYLDTRYTKNYGSFASTPGAIFYWYQLSGPSQALPDGANIDRSPIRNGQSFYTKKLTVGTYIFRLEVRAGQEVASDTLVLQVVNDPSAQNTVAYMGKWENYNIWDMSFCPSVYWYLRPDLIDGNAPVNSARMQYRAHDDNSWHPLTTEKSNRIYYQYYPASQEIYVDIKNGGCDNSYEDKVIAIRFFK